MLDHVLHLFKAFPVPLVLDRLITLFSFHIWQWCSAHISDMIKLFPKNLLHGISGKAIKMNIFSRKYTLFSFMRVCKIICAYFDVLWLLKPKLLQ